MARNKSFNPYDEQDEEIVGAYDEEPNDSEYMSYGSPPAMAEEDYPDEPMPLFLSGGDEEPRHRGFGTGGERLLDRAPIGPSVFKGAIVATSAAAIAFAILGYETLRGRPSNVPGATGSPRAVPLGAIAPYDLSELLERMYG